MLPRSKQLRASDPHDALAQKRARANPTPDDDDDAADAEWDEEPTIDKLEAGEHYLVDLQGEPYPTGVVQLLSKDLAKDPDQPHLRSKREDAVLKCQWYLRIGDTALGQAHVREAQRDTNRDAGGCRTTVRDAPPGAEQPVNLLWLCRDNCWGSLKRSHIIRRVEVRRLRPGDPVPPVEKDVYYVQQSYSKRFK
ncbi:hypothetical protein Agub_g1227, partial [Astrephomene gubernaculifera]